MARPESISLGGYYKTPPHVTRLIARLLDASAVHASAHMNFVDPCAGDGEALDDLANTLFPRPWNTSRTNGRTISLFGCELERDRFDAMEQRFKDIYGWAKHGVALYGDAFRVSWDEPRADVLYLNPPYDVDKDGRLEHRFLTRFAPVLVPGKGILLYVVPFYALSEDATYLATHFEDIHCFRFPAADFEFKQIVLAARRREQPRRFDASQSPEARMIQRWAADAETIPVLSSQQRPVLTLPVKGSHWGLNWEMRDLDVRGLYEAAEPWREGKGSTLKPMRGLGLDSSLDELIGARYPVIMPPRPAHVAIALAAGLVNGREVQPNDPASNLPPIMVKGVFRKEYKVIEEKTDKKGNVTGQVMVQQPKLEVTVLNMRDWTYHDLQAGSEPSGTRNLEEFNIADLLTHYGQGLAALMGEQCPPLHDPTDPAQLLVLPELGYTPFTIQHHVISAALKVFFTDQHPFANERPFVLGEVGTGKTLSAAAVAESLSEVHFADTLRQVREMGISVGGRQRPVRRVLVMCPPHLVQGWTDQLNDILPGAQVKLLERIGDVREAAAIPIQATGDQPGSGLLFLLLSREMAKLGHAWADGRHKGQCPTCGAFHSQGEKAILSERAVCSKRPMHPRNEWARWAMRLAAELAHVLPEDTDVTALVGGRMMEKRLHRRLTTLLDIREDARPDRQQHIWEYRRGVIPRLIDFLLEQSLALAADKQWHELKTAVHQLTLAFAAADWPERDEALVQAATAIYAETLSEKNEYSTAADVRKQLRELVLLMKAFDSPLQQATLATMDYKDNDVEMLRYEYEGRQRPSYVYYYGPFSFVGGRLHYRVDYQTDHPIGHFELARKLFDKLLELADFEDGEPCNTPLFTAIPQPRRYPLADYVAKRYPNLFDLLVIDEAHEYSTDGSAQERAAHRLADMGKPVLALTGTSNNGYASSLFMNMWYLSRRFRAEFGRDALQEFVNRYGYRKVLAEVEDNGRRSNYGAMTDRVDTGASLMLKKMGEAPGVLPLFILKHLLPVAVQMHKSDMDHELPPLVEIGVPLTAEGALVKQYEKLREALVSATITDLKNYPDLAGKLWGQFAQLPTYLDRAHSDTGNADAPDGGRRFEVRYPPSVGGALVAAAKPLPPDELSGKEEWLLETLEAELAEGRPCLVFVVNTNSGLSHRVARVIDANLGKNTSVILDATKISAAKRQEWINQRVVNPRRKVLVVNPKAVETGLNNLVYFPTGIWFQNPNCSPVIYTQANGRLHRPGQKADEVRIYVPYYAKTAQEAQFNLLGHKVAASRQTDGVDITSALIAAGAAEQDGIDAMAVGQAIYNMLTGQESIRANGFASATVSRHAASVANGRSTSPLKTATDQPKPDTLPDLPPYHEPPPENAIQLRLLEAAPVYAGFGD